MKLIIIALAGTLAASAASVPSNVTYYKDVAPVLQSRCQECHRSGEVAPMSFTSYDELGERAFPLRQLPARL